MRDIEPQPAAAVGAAETRFAFRPVFETNLLTALLQVAAKKNTYHRPRNDVAPAVMVEAESPRADQFLIAQQSIQSGERSELGVQRYAPNMDLAAGNESAGHRRCKH